MLVLKLLPAVLVVWLFSTYPTAEGWIYNEKKTHPTKHNPPKNQPKTQNQNRNGI